MRLKHTNIQLALEMAALLCILAMWIYLFKSWDSLPDQIASHYNAAGVADSWGSKNGILMLPIVGTVLYLLISVLSFFPATWNVPVKITAENRELVYGTMKTLLISVKLEIIACFAYITYCDIQLRSLGVWFLPVFLVVLFGTMLVCIVRARRKI